MTDAPNDQIDPYESRLARRVGSFSDQAIVPIDAVAVAASASMAARRRTLGGRFFGSSGSGGRLALVGAATLLVVALGVFVGAGGIKLFAPVQATPSAAVSPGPTVLVADVCSHRALSGRIVSWDGAAGSRIARVVVTNDAPTACLLPTILQATLVDKLGAHLIAGAAPSGTPASITLGSGLSATTLVEVANYCGPDPVAPATIQFTMSDDGVFGLSPDDRLGDVDGVPPCNGPTLPGSIQMQPFQGQ